MSRPPYHVPPEDLSLWDIEDEKLSTKEEFRKHIIDLNDKFDMEEVFENLEVGLFAFQKRVRFCSEFPKYSLTEDLKRMYVEKDNIIVKDFIQLGDRFARTYQTNLNEVNESDAVVENDLEKLSQLDSDSTKPVEKVVLENEIVV